VTTDPRLIDGIVLIVLAIAGFWGWRRGALVMALSLGGMVVGYLGAYLLFRPVGTILIGATAIPPVLAYPLASLGLWFVIGGLAGFLQSRAMKKRRELRKDGWRPSSVDGAVGALLGATWGVGLVAVVLWAMLGAHSVTGRGPSVAETASAQATSALAERVVYTVAHKVTNEELIASAMSIVAANPAEGTRTLKTVLQDNRFVQLLSNSTTRSQLLAGDIVAVSDYPSIKELSADPTFRAAAERLSLLGEGSSPAEALASGLVPVAETLEDLLADEEIAALVTDTELMARVRKGDLTSLATDTDFNRLARRVLTVLRAGTKP
jgi:Colicin V production protein